MQNTAQPVLSTTRLQKVDAICNAFEVAFKAGKNPRAEEFLAGLDDDLQKVLLPELLQLELHYRQDCSPAELSSRFPNLEPSWLNDLTGGVDANAYPLIPGYFIMKELGRGGMGIVYLAADLQLRRHVALKMIHRSSHISPELRRRFLGEAHAAARLQHPNLVQIFDVGEFEGHPYLVFELVEGGTLAEQIRDDSLTHQKSAEMMETLCRAIQFAHDRHIVHRDLKPSNILLGNDGVPRISDFGLAKRLDEDVQQTISGQLVGTPSYMAPEQIESDSSTVGPACDVYALGAVLYDMLIGRPPFRAPTVLETIQQVRCEEPIPPRSLLPALPRDLETICLKCLQKQPERRYHTAAEVADDLRRFLNGEPIQARAAGLGEKLGKWARRHPSIAALFAVVVLGIIGIASQWMRAEVNRAAAVRQTAAANQARAAEQTEHQLAIRVQYAHDVQLARLMYESNNTAQAIHLLDTCPAQLRHWEWYFVRSLCQDDRVSFPPMPRMIKDIDWSPDGRLVAACTATWGLNEPGQLNVWEADTGRLRFSVEAHTTGVLTVNFSHDSTRVVTAGTTWHGPLVTDGVKVWDVNDGSEVLAIAKTQAFSAVFSPDDRTLAIGRSTGDIGLHDSNTGAEMAVLKGHSNFASDLAFRSDGKFLASAGRDGTMSVWDLESHQQFAVVEGLRDVRHVAYFPNQTDIAMGTFGGVLKVYRQESQGVRETATLTRGTSLRALQLGPDGQTLVASVVNRPAVLLDVKSEAPLRELPGHNGYATAASFSPDGRRVATAGADGVVTIWDLIAPVQPRRTSLGGPHTADLAFHPSGHQLAVAAGLNTGTSRERVLRLWDVQSRSVTAVLRGHTDPLTSVAFHPLGSSIITGSDDKTVRLWDSKTGQLVRTFVGHEHSVTAVAFVGDDIASGSRDGTIRLWNAASGEEMKRLKHEEQPVLAMAAQRDGLLASVTTNGLLWIWDAATGRQRARIAGTSTKSARLVFSPDGSLLAFASDQPAIELWDLSKVLEHHAAGTMNRIAESKLQLVGHTDNVTGIAFSPDGKRMASISDDRYVKIWDVVRGTEVLSLAGLFSYSSRVAFGPDGRQLVQSGHFYLDVWEAELGPPVATMTAKMEEGSGQPSETRTALARDWHYSQWQRANANKNWYAAAFHRNHLQELEPDEPHHVTMRGVAYAELGRMDEALADWDHSYDKFSRPWDIVELSYRQALVGLMREDDERYRQICRQLWDKHSSTDNIDLANRIAWTCCLASDSGVPAEDYLKLSELGATNRRISGRLNTLGACLFRAKRFDEAIATLNESMKLQGRGGLPHDWAFLALSHGALGNAEASREYLEKTVAWLAEQKQHADNDKPVDALYRWNNRIELGLFIEEARALLASNESNVVP